MEARAGFVLPSDEKTSSRTEFSWLNNTNVEKTKTESLGSTSEKAKHLGGDQESSARQAAPSEVKKEKELANLFSDKAQDLMANNSGATSKENSGSSGPRHSAPTNHLPSPNDKTPPSNNLPLPPGNTGQGMGGSSNGFGSGSMTQNAGLPSLPTVVGPELAIRLFAKESPLLMEEFAWRFFRPPRG